MTPRRAFITFVAGCCWGIVALLLGARAFGAGFWAGVIASPLIGVAVGATTQPLFERTSGWRRTLTSLCSVYLGAIAFALPVGVFELFARNPSGRQAVAVLVETELAVLWGVTLFIIGLWPLAYFSHVVIEWAAER